jgi:hypothetical protein
MKTLILTGLAAATIAALATAQSRSNATVTPRFELRS